MTNEEKQQLKARFFGLHIGAMFVHPDYDTPRQILGVATYDMPEVLPFKTGSVFTETGWTDIERSQLILRPLPSLTLEHAKEIADLLGLPFIGSGKIAQGGARVEITSTICGSREDSTIWIFADGMVMFFENNGDYGGAKFSRINNTLVIDFLRSKSYCLPFHGLDVISEGWAILETTNQPQG